MNLRIAIAVQFLVLALAVGAGTMLNSDLADGPRDFHRYVGTFAGLMGVVVVAMSFIAKAPMKIRKMALGSLLLTLLAAYAGNSLSDTDSYDTLFNVMRGGAALAAFLSLATLTMYKPETAPVKFEEPTPPDEE